MKTNRTRIIDAEFIRHTGIDWPIDPAIRGQAGTITRETTHGVFVRLDTGRLAYVPRQALTAEPKPPRHICQGCGEILSAEDVAQYRITYRDRQLSSANYCDICAQIVNSGQAEHVAAAILEAPCAE